MSTTQPAETQTALAQEQRLRERLAAVHDAWRVLDDWIDDVLADEGELTGRASRDVARHQQRMADAVDLLEREWVMRATRGTP